MYPPASDTSAAVARIAAQIESLGREIGHLRRETADDMARIESALARVEEQTTLTNGRVTDLEKTREHDDGVREAHQDAALTTLRKVQITTAILAVVVSVVAVLVSAVLAFVA